jgi:hypothetical protein
MVLLLAQMPSATGSAYTSPCNADDRRRSVVCSQRNESLSGVFTLLISLSRYRSGIGGRTLTLVMPGPNRRRQVHRQLISQAPLIPEKYGVPTLSMTSVASI